MNRNLRKALLSGDKISDLKDAKRKIESYLMNYHATIHETTGKTPAEMILRQKFKTRLEIQTEKEPTEEEKELKEKVQNKLRRRAAYANTRRRPMKDNHFKMGDLVQAQGGPIRNIVKKIGRFTFLTNEGYTVNCRKLKLIKRQQDRKHNERGEENELRKLPERIRREPSFLKDYDRLSN